MKILHTSDWHLGHTLYNFDRREEFISLLDQMEEIVRNEQPDVFLICGDIYHTAQPSTAIQTLFADTLFKIHAANPQMYIVVTAGNHDSGSKLDIFQTPWKKLNVFTIGNLSKDNPEQHIIEIPGKGYIVAIPYCYERNIPEGFFQHTLDIASERNKHNLPIVMTAHTTVQGCDFLGHDNATDLSVGGIDALTLASMGEGYDYLALGHIHRAQFIHSGKHNVRYCGTPLPISFDEPFEHTVSLVEIAGHGVQPVIETIGIKTPKPLITLPPKGYSTWDKIKQELADYPDDIPAYIRLNVLLDDTLPTNANDEALAITKNKLCQFCHINLKRENGLRSEQLAMTLQEFKAIAPIEVAKRFAEYEGETFSDEMAEIFKELEQLVQEEERNN